MASYDIHMIQGTDHTVQITWSESGETVDLTGWDGLFQIRETPGADTPLFADASPTLDSTTNAAVTIPAATTAGWSLPAYRPVKTSQGVPYVYAGDYEFKLTDPDGVSMTLARGQVWVSPGVAR